MARTAQKKAVPVLSNIERPAKPKPLQGVEGRTARFLQPDAAHPPLRGARRAIYGLGLIGGFCHLYIGQEAVAVGLQSAMKVGRDSVITGYRDHGHMLAYGIDPKLIMAELTGRAAGISKGKGGSMHMFSVEHGFYGGHGIVGAQVSSAPGSPSSTNMPRMAASAWPISATARPTRARSTRASTWRSCGTCR